MIYIFSNNKKYNKRIKKSQRMSDYLETLNDLFSNEDIVENQGLFEWNMNLLNHIYWYISIIIIEMLNKSRVEYDVSYIDSLISKRIKNTNTSSEDDIFKFEKIKRAKKEAKKNNPSVKLIQRIYLVILLIKQL